MPIVYAGVNDGVISNTDNVDWATTRDAASGDSVNTAGPIIGTAYGVSRNRNWNFWCLECL